MGAAERATPLADLGSPCNSVKRMARPMSPSRWIAPRSNKVGDRPRGRFGRGRPVDTGRYCSGYGALGRRSAPIQPRSHGSTSVTTATTISAAETGRVNSGQKLPS